MFFDLLTALVAGSAVGLAVHAVPSWRHLPLWLAPAVGTAASFGAILAVRASGVETGGRLHEIVAQIVFAFAGVLVLGLTASRRRDAIDG
ncbi:MAG: hypothetical protein SYR96_19035 [Actinomycetota bacterium]|nr:hypothetical protein [Actinomycetota bacterium]